MAKRQKSPRSDKKVSRSKTAATKSKRVSKDLAKVGLMDPTQPMPVTNSALGTGLSSVLRSRLGFCLYKCAIRLRSLLDQAFLEAGLITPQFGIMSILSANGPLSQNVISQHMTIDKATMVKLIDGLEAVGYVQRTPHPQDRRVRMVELTKSGESTFERLLGKAKEVELSFTARLTPEERETLRQLTSRLLDPAPEPATKSPG